MPPNNIFIFVLLNYIRRTSKSRESRDIPSGDLIRKSWKPTPLPRQGIVNEIGKSLNDLIYSKFIAIIKNEYYRSY